VDYFRIAISNKTSWLPVSRPATRMLVLRRTSAVQASTKLSLLLF